MRKAYNKLSHVIRNNVPIIRVHLREIEKRLVEIEEAFDGHTGTDDAIPVVEPRPGDAEKA